MMQYSKSIKSAINVKLISLAVTAVLLSGCQSIGPDYLRQVFNLPEKFSQPVATKFFRQVKYLTQISRA